MTLQISNLMKQFYAQKIADVVRSDRFGDLTPKFFAWLDNTIRRSNSDYNKSIFARQLLDFIATAPVPYLKEHESDLYNSNKHWIEKLPKPQEVIPPMPRFVQFVLINKRIPEQKRFEFLDSILALIGSSDGSSSRSVVLDSCVLANQDQEAVRNLLDEWEAISQQQISEPASK